MRQNLSALLEVVKTGREILVTEHGRPVARLVPVESVNSRAFPDLSKLRAQMPQIVPPLSEALEESRADRV